MKKSINRLIGLMLGTNQLIRQGSKNCHGMHHLSIIQLRTLLHIEKSGKTAMKDIAAYLGVAAPTATAMINNLENDGFVLRQADKADRRQMYIKISAKGRKKSVEAMAHIKGKLTYLFAKLTEEEQEQFVGLLEKILITE